MTKVQIANVALSKLGHTSRIADLSEGSEEARMVNDVWDYLREQALSYHEWRFARKRVTLATIGTPGEAWGYRYALPTDCMLPIIIEDNEKDREPDEKIEWEQIVDTSTGSPVPAIDCDELAAELVYIYSHDTVAYWPPHFVNAFVWTLAAELAMPITSEPVIADRTVQRALLEMSKAISTDLRSSEQKKQRDSTFVTSRY